MEKKRKLEESDLEKVAGGAEERTVLGSVPSGWEEPKYIVGDASPTAADIISELKS